jgi:hypothetical protein
MVVRAIGPAGELKADAATQMALHSDEERAKLLDELVLNLSPPAFDLGQLSSWLDGGSSPFPKKGLDKVGKECEWPGQTLVRSAPRVSRQSKRVEALKAELAAEEQKLAYAQAHERAAIQWFVTDHLIKLISPVFAMGPAWTLMRAVSGHLPEEVGEAATSYLEGNQKEQALGKMRSDRVMESETLHAALDFFSGAGEFEEAVRGALLKVCRDFDKRREEFATEGRRSRSKKARQTEVHPKAQNDASDVLDGLKRAG